MFSDTDPAKLLVLITKHMCSDFVSVPDMISQDQHGLKGSCNGHSYQTKSRPLITHPVLMMVGGKVEM